MKTPQKARIEEKKPTTAIGAGSEKKDGSRLSSVAAAIRLLKAFSEENAELGISTLSRSLKVSKSTVHRLASTLLSEGLIRAGSGNRAL